LDIAANVFLPYLNAQLALTAGADSAAAQRVRDAYVLLPPSQENRLLKEAIQRFLTPPSRSRELIQRLPPTRTDRHIQKFLSGPG